MKDYEKCDFRIRNRYICFHDILDLHDGFSKFRVVNLTFDHLSIVFFLWNEL